MAIAADKIKNLLDEARDEALKAFQEQFKEHAFSTESYNEGMASILPILQRIEAYKQVLELDVTGVGNEVRVSRPVAPVAPPMMPTSSRTTFDAQGRIVEQKEMAVLPPVATTTAETII